MAETRAIGLETAFSDQVRCDYDGSNNLIYLGRARAGAATSDSIWRIAKLTYDGSNNLTNIQWAGGQPAYVNVWDSRTTYSYS